VFIWFTGRWPNSSSWPCIPVRPIQMRSRQISKSRTSRSRLREANRWTEPARCLGRYDRALLGTFYNQDRALRGLARRAMEGSMKTEAVMCDVEERSPAGDLKPQFYAKGLQRPIVAPVQAAGSWAFGDWLAFSVLDHQEILRQEGCHGSITTKRCSTKAHSARSNYLHRPSMNTYPSCLRSYRGATHTACSRGGTSQRPGVQTYALPS